MCKTQQYRHDLITSPVSRHQAARLTDFMRESVLMVSEGIGVANKKTHAPETLFFGGSRASQSLERHDAVAKQYFPC